MFLFCKIILYFNNSKKVKEITNLKYVVSVWIYFVNMWLILFWFKIVLVYFISILLLKSLILHFCHKWFDILFQTRYDVAYVCKCLYYIIYVFLCLYILIEEDDIFFCTVSSFISLMFSEVSKVCEVLYKVPFVATSISLENNNKYIKDWMKKI